MIIEELKKFKLNDTPITLLKDHKEIEKITKIESIKIRDIEVNKFTNEFWTPKQRQANSIHEISYRACYKPQLPRFFIERLTEEGDIVYDPFSGRGTTILEAGLQNRQVISNDINPLSEILSKPRFLIPDIKVLTEYIDKIEIDYNLNADIDLSMFYHPKTESELISIKNFIFTKKKNGNKNKYDDWIRMVATNRLTGHSKGFFSVYTLPPNQAVTASRQIKINETRRQMPEYRDVKKFIQKKTKSLIRDMTPNKIQTLKNISNTAIFLSNDASKTKKIKNNTVKLTVTSPPFLDVVQYADDNWLRCWFNGIDEKSIRITMAKTIVEWSKVMQNVFNELYRITIVGGFVAFEVGEIKNGTIKLDEYVVPLGINAGFETVGIVINEQQFTKTSNIWGINNNKKGTNSNRIVIFKK